MTAPFTYFGQLARKKQICFDNVDISVNRMKSTFFSGNLWSWASLYIVDRPRSLVDFLPWLDCK